MKRSWASTAQPKRTPETFKRFKAVLVVGQTVELEPALAAAIKASGLPVYCDGTCRPGVVSGFTPLGTSFNLFEKDTHPASDDAAYFVGATLSPNGGLVTAVLH